MHDENGEKSLNKTQFIDAISRKYNISKLESTKIVDCYQETLCDIFQQGKSVKILNFGVFRLTSSKARVGVNPKTGQPMNIPASKSVSFRISKTRKVALNG